MEYPGLWVENSKDNMHLFRCNVGQKTTGRGSTHTHLLNFGILLNVNFLAAIFIQLNSLHRIEGDAASQVKLQVIHLGVDGTVDNLQHQIPVIDVNRGARKKEKHLKCLWQLIS